PISDTVKRVQDGIIQETIDRSHLWGAQTPQGFRREMLLDLCDRALAEGVEFTDEASLGEALGQPVAIVPGDRLNIKMTHPEDREVIDALLRRRQEETCVRYPRSGIGYDVHRFAENRPM